LAMIWSFHWITELLIAEYRRLHFNPGFCHMKLYTALLFLKLCRNLGLRTETKWVEGKQMQRYSFLVQTINIDIANHLQKRKRNSEIKPVGDATSVPGPVASAPATPATPATIYTSKPTAVFQPTEGRPWTVTVALPGSIIAK
jgi:hypothetical protein